jgi:ferredoxin--NADP+ reductase
LTVGLVFRAVGYRGVPLADIPFNDRWGVILNEKGRVIDPSTKLPVVGLYTSGWIKRGPSGVIGTNKPDSVETASMMLEDLSSGAILNPAHADPASAEKFICDKQPYVTYRLAQVR